MEPEEKTNNTQTIDPEISKKPIIYEIIYKEKDQESGKSFGKRSVTVENLETMIKYGFFDQLVTDEESKKLYVTKKYKDFLENNKFSEEIDKNLEECKNEIKTFNNSNKIYDAKENKDFFNGIMDFNDDIKEKLGKIRKGKTDVDFSEEIESLNKKIEELKDYKKKQELIKDELANNPYNKSGDEKDSNKALGYITKKIELCEKLIKNLNNTLDNLKKIQELLHGKENTTSQPTPEPKPTPTQKREPEQKQEPDPDPEPTPEPIPESEPEQYEPKSPVVNNNQNNYYNDSQPDMALMLKREHHPILAGMLIFSETKVYQVVRHPIKTLKATKAYQAARHPIKTIKNKRMAKKEEKEKRNAELENNWNDYIKDLRENGINDSRRDNGHNIPNMGDHLTNSHSEERDL